MTLKQIVQLSLPIYVGVGSGDTGSKIIQCDDMDGLKEKLIKEIESVGHHPQNSISGKNILTRVALAMGWVKHEFDVAATLITPERRHFFLYYDDRFRDIDPELFKLITDIDICSIVPGGSSGRVSETYNAINRKPENLLANFDLVVKNGIGNLFEYIHIPAEHYHGAIGYGAGKDVRVMNFTTNPKRYISDYPFMFFMGRGPITKVFKVLAAKALERGCVDEYTWYYHRVPSFIKKHPTKQKVILTGKYEVVIDHPTVLTLVMNGHYSDIRFKYNDTKSIKITIDNRVWFSELYDCIDEAGIITVNPIKLEFIRNLAISKREYRDYVRWNNPRDIKGNVADIPYFFWLEELLKKLEAGLIADWATTKMWAWVESLGFIENRKCPLNTIKRPYVNTWLSLQEHGKK